MILNYSFHPKILITINWRKKIRLPRGERRREKSNKLMIHLKYFQNWLKLRRGKEISI